MSRTFLITGALGAIGAWTSRSLIERGHRVIAFDLHGDPHRLTVALEREQVSEVVRVNGDITDLTALERALEAHEVAGVIHLAALQVPSVQQSPLLGARVNVVGTISVLEAVRRRQLPTPVVYASSVAVYGPNGTLDGNDPPGTLYGAFKRANELTAIRYYDDYGVSSIGLRPHTVYGPGRDQGLTSAPTTAMLAAAAGVPYRIPFGGSIQLQYAPDVGEAFARTALLEVRGASTHNLDGEVVSIPDLVEIIGGVINDRQLITAANASLPLVSAVDGSSFVRLLGESVMRPVTDGVRDTIRRFATLLANGDIPFPSPNSPSPSVR